MLVRRAALACAVAVVPALVGLTVPLVPVAPARAADNPDCTSLSPDDEQLTVTGANAASDALQVPEATDLVRRAGRRPGQDVTVVVVDTDIPGGVATGRRPDLPSNHGLTAAGIVGGPAQDRPAVEVGIAPAAQVTSRSFYDAPRGDAGEGETTPTARGLAAALNGIAVGKRTIVLVPTVVGRDAGLVRAIDRLHRAGALVIAPVGDIPDSDSGFLSEYAGETKPGQDAVADVWPAADDDVIAVGASSPQAATVALRNSGVDLAAPGIGSVSIGVQGGRCVVGEPSTSWAAAEVAGVAALVWSFHRTDTADQLRQRLQGTASGNGDASPLVGYGVVQPVEALQRPLEAMGGESQRSARVPRAEVPPKRADLLAETRHDAVWWGVGGAGALVVLLVLRPVLARRRR